MYRPEGWSNPFKETMVMPSTGVYRFGFQHDAFEAGADAMLEALIALPLSQEINWEYMNSDTYGSIGLKILMQYDGKRINGWLVFIPEG